MLNIETIRTYCNTLSSSQDGKEIWTWGLFDESGKGGVIPGYGTFSCPVSDLEEMVSGVEVPYSLHTTLNTTDLDRRKNDNIRSVRCLCVDLDRKVPREEVKSLVETYNPDMVVESSPGKYHFYWKVSPSITLEAWSLYQMGLARKLGGDLNLSGKAHMIRVPGCERVTKEGELFMPDIVKLVDSAGMRTDPGIRAAFPWIVREGEQGRLDLAADRQRVRDALAAKHRGKVGGVTAGTAGRNDALYNAVNEFVFKNKIEDIDAAIGYGLEVNAQFESPLDESEVWWCAKSAFSHANEGRQRTDKERAETLLPPLEPSDTLDTLEMDSLEPLDGANLPPAGKNGTSHHVENKPAEQRDPEPQECPLPKGKKKLKDLPEDINEAIDEMVEKIWGSQKRGVRACRLIKHGVSTGQFLPLIDWFQKVWRLVGKQGRGVPAIFVRGESAWGSDVWRLSEVSKDQFVAIFVTVCSQVYLRGMKLKEFNKTKYPKCSTLSAAGDLAWKVFLNNKSGERQPGNLIVFQNGVLDLDRQVWTEDELAPKHYSHAIDARFDPTLLRATPVWDKFLEDWFPGDKATKEIIMRWFGYSMTTEFERQKFMFMWGPTGSGKGSLSSVLGGLVGGHNSVSMNYGALAGSGAGAGKFQEAEMHNKLLITVEEAEGTIGEHAGRMDRLKKLVGGERILVERKFLTPFQDYVIGKLVLQSNVAPVYQDKGGAIRARMIPIGFEHSFREVPSLIPPSKQIFDAGEADQIASRCAFAWMTARKQAKPFEIEGSRALEVGREAVASEMDLVGSTLKKFLVLDTKAAVQSAAMSELIKLACDDRGVAVSGALEREIKSAMTYWPQVRLTRFRKNGGAQCRGWVGVRLNKEAIVKEFSYLPESASQYIHLAKELKIEASATELDGLQMLEQ